MSAAREPLLELTSARFLAAMAVLLGHFLHAFAPWFSLGPFAALVGGFGVTFFFVLSGFILCYRYWDDFAGGVRPRAYRRYFVARVARVYPSYVAALVLITLLYMVLEARQPGSVQYPANTVSSWLWNLAALQTFARTYATQQYWNAPAWSISTELCFYLACPFIFALVARYCRSMRSLLAVLAVAVAWALVTQAAILKLVLRDGWDAAFWIDMVATRNIFFRIPEFVCGIALARLLYEGYLPALAKPRARNALLLLGVSGLFVLGVLPTPSDPAVATITERFRTQVGYLPPLAAMIVALAAGPTAASPLLRLPAMVFLGDASYAVYIYHWIPWTALDRAQANGTELSGLLVTGVILGTLLFSAASFVAFERPLRSWIRKVAAPGGP